MHPIYEGSPWSKSDPTQEPGAWGRGTANPTHFSTCHYHRRNPPCKRKKKRWKKSPLRQISHDGESGMMGASSPPASEFLGRRLLGSLAPGQRSGPGRGACVFPDTKVDPVPFDWDILPQVALLSSPYYYLPPRKAIVRIIHVSTSMTSWSQKTGLTQETYMHYLPKVKIKNQVSVKQGREWLFTTRPFKNSLAIQTHVPNGSPQEKKKRRVRCRRRTAHLAYGNARAPASRMATAAGTGVLWDTQTCTDTP